MTYDNLFAAVLLSFVIERVLAVFFDITGFGEKLKVRGAMAQKHTPSFVGASFKGVAAAILAIAICVPTDINILDEIIKGAKGLSATTPPELLGELVTGVFIAGGSQGSVKLFQDVLGFSKANRDTIKKAREETEKARQEQAKRDQAAAALERTRLETALVAAENEQKLSSYRADTAKSLAKIERKTQLEQATIIAGVTHDPLLLRSPADPYLRDVIDDWEEFVNLRADLRLGAATSPASPQLTTPDGTPVNSINS